MSRKFRIVIVLVPVLFLMIILASLGDNLSAETNNFIWADSGQELGDSYSYGIALGDLDGDMDLDAFVANRYAPNTVWLNDGHGMYTDSSQSLGGNEYSFGVALGDLDNDTDLDAFVVNSVGTSDSVWLNNGNGVFTTTAQNLGNSYSHAVALGDVDGDNDLDAAVAVRTNASIFYPAPNLIWLNNGNGTFTDSGQLLGLELSQGIALADLDNDGDLDIFVANTGPNTVWINNGSGVFTDTNQLLGNSNSQDVALGDLDDDGDLDAFIANESSPNEIWLNDGNANFTNSGQSLGNSYSYGVALGDVDNDNDLDAFVANVSADGGNLDDPAPNKVWLNDGSAVFSDSGVELGNLHSSDVVLGALNNDGTLDALVSNRGDLAGNYGEPNKVWFNIEIQRHIFLPLAIRED